MKLGPKGQIHVDDYSRTNVPSIWAVGDVTDRIQVRAFWFLGAFCSPGRVSTVTKPLLSFCCAKRSRFLSLNIC